MGLLNYTVMEQPCTAAEILKNLDDDGQISGVVGISLDDIIENDMEGFDDILTERLVGLNCCLSEISYDVVGVEPDENFLHIRVSGYVDDVDYLESQCDKQFLPPFGAKTESAFSEPQTASRLNACSLFCPDSKGPCKSRNAP